MTYTTDGIQDFLSELEPFEQLPPEGIAEVSAKLQPLRYRMGQVILMREKMPPHVAILYEGKARLLGYDPRNQMPATLQLLERGNLLGCVNQLRGVACETAIASTEVICLTLSNREFHQLLEKYPQWATSFREKCYLVEAFDLIGYHLGQQARGDGNLKELALDAISFAEVYSLPVGKTKLKEDSPLLEKNKVWLFSGGKVANLEKGSRLNLTAGSSIEVTGTGSARFLGFPLSLLEPVEDNYLLAETEDHWQDTPPVEVEVEVVEGEQPREEIPYAQAELLEEEIPEERETKDPKAWKNYPYVRGKTPLDAGVACFQMLSKYFGMPFRKDTIAKIIAEQMRRTGTISLNLCGAVAELMGLNAQLIKISPKVFSRLKTPGLVRWQDSLAILYEISDRFVVIGVPERGILRRKPEEFLETWQDDGQVLILEPTKETPQERFGLSWFIPVVSQYRGVLLQVFIASFFVQLFGLAHPLMIRVVIDKVIGQNSADTMQVLGIFMVVISVFEALLTTLRTYLFVDTTNRIDMTLGSEIIDHLLRLPLRYFEKRPVGEISTRVNELENIRQFLTGTALTVVLDSVFSVIYIAVMVIISPLMTVVSLSVIPVFVVLTLIFSPVIRRQLRVKAERNAETQSHLVEVMSGIQTVKAQNIELRSRWEWQQRYARYVSAGFKTVVTSTIASSASNFLNKLSTLLVLWVGVYLALAGQISLGTLIAFRILSGYVTSPILRLTQLWQNFQETALSLERLSDIVDHPQEAEKDKGNIPMPSIVGALKYENVSFRFKHGGPLQLNNVNLEFAPGTFVGIVGQSGAGKSTLTKLISRLYEPEAGRILIDSYDINKVELYSLRRQVGVVPQDTLLFDGTVQENIALTNPDATTEEIVEAARVAAAHEFIMNLANGYNTRVGERGASLSGGQRQRIALARSVLQNPNILVLDEATSALDYSTEQQVCLNLAEAFKDTTVLFITHRLGTIKNADVIVMMDSGSVVEQGKHEELMALKGRYYYLYNQQESKI